MRLERLMAAGVVCVALAGCSLGNLLRGADHTEAEPAKPRADGSVIAEYLETMRKLSQSDPAVQAETFQQTARPRTCHRPRPIGCVMRWRLLHPATVAAMQRPRRSCSHNSWHRPNLLLPAEQALVEVELRQIELRLVLSEENRRLQQESARAERERSTAAARRLQAELDENKRLRKQLEEALAKLDAVTHIEQRSSIDRNSNGNQP